MWVGDVAACIYYIIMYMRLKPLNGQVHRKKTWFYPKTRVFWISQISISALSHEVLPLMLKIQQCSYQHAASVLCRAGLETLLGNIPTFLTCMPYHFPSTKCSDKQCQFLHTRDIRNNLNRIIICKIIHDEQATSFSHEICPRKDHQWA